MNDISNRNPVSVDDNKYMAVLEDLYSRLQAFHRVGSSAYKPGLQNVSALAEAFGNPHRKFRTIHVAGTNGKGSTAHLLASVLSAAGYSTGLYTSPHLVDFNERIRINGSPISHTEVIDFVERFSRMKTSVDPSFFELATVMAFDHFARHNVDVAVIEVGLGGRLDATNIITPDLSIVTNISLDHTGILGYTLEEIAREKAGIFKSGVPALVGEADVDLRKVFTLTAERVGAPLTFAQDLRLFSSKTDEEDNIIYKGSPWGEIICPLTGSCQPLNTATVLTALYLLKDYNISSDAVREGFENVCSSTGLMARWMTVSRNPRIICDTGHNPGAWQYLGPKLASIGKTSSLSVVIGFVSDKDFGSIFHLLPLSAKYYIVTPSTPRAADADAVLKAALAAGLDATICGSVDEGFFRAKSSTPVNGTIFIGGSTFVVADFLQSLQL